MERTGKTGTISEKVTNGICYMCTHCCPQRVHVREGVAAQIEMADPVLAQLCPRWKAQLDFVYHPERLQVPLKREGIGRTGRFVPTSWDEALDIVADGLNRVKTQYGPESVVFWIAYTKEPRPYFHRLTHAFGSPNYLTESSSCFSAQWLAAVLTYGKEYGYWFQYSTPVNAATQCKLIWGSSIRQSRPPVYQQHLEAKAKGLKLIVVDPIRTHLASKADIHLQLRPGTDGALALGMINVILREGLFDRDFVEKWTVGFDELKKLAGEYTVHRAERITGVPAKTIEQAAVMYAMQKPAQIAMSANSTSHHYNGVQNHRAIIALPALTGNVAVKGGNCSPPRHLPLNDISLHERLSAMPPGVGAERFPLWTGLYREMEANMLAERMGSDKPYPIKALFGAGLNPMFFPNSNHFVERVKKLDFVVVTDYFQTPGTDLADVVLPISSWLERRILLTQPTGVTFIEPAIEPVGQTLPEWNIFSELAKRLGFGSEFWNGDQEACFDHMLKPLGITVADLLKQPDHTIKPAMNIRPERYYEEAGFETPSGKVELASSVLENHGHDALPVYKEPLESPLSRPDMLASFPLVMTTGARTLAYTHSLFRNIARLRELTPDPLVDIHPVDAEARGIKTGDPVKVTAPRGAVMMKAHVTDAILPGVVSAPHHWAGEANINVIMDDKDLDPISGFAPFKSSLCQVLKA